MFSSVMALWGEHGIGDVSPTRICQDPPPRHPTPRGITSIPNPMGTQLMCQDPHSPTPRVQMGSNHPDPKHVPITWGSIAQPLTLQMSHRLSPTLRPPPSHAQQSTEHSTRCRLIGPGLFIYLFLRNDLICWKHKMVWSGGGRGGGKNIFYH